jgi:hypothetical protein
MEDVHTPSSSYEIRENLDIESCALLKDLNAILHVFYKFFVKVSSNSAQNVFAKMHWFHKNRHNESCS